MLAVDVGEIEIAAHVRCPVDSRREMSSLMQHLGATQINTAEPSGPLLIWEIGA